MSESTMTTKQEDPPFSENTEDLFCNEDNADDDEYSYEYIDSDDEKKIESTKENESPARLNKRKASVLLSESSHLYASAATNLRGYKQSQHCQLCGKESHIPVVDCQSAARWIQRGQDEASGILTLPSSCVSPVVSKRIREFAKRLNSSEEETAMVLRRFAWREEELRNRNWDMGWLKRSWDSKQARNDEYQKFLQTTIDESGSNIDLPEEDEDTDDITPSSVCDICMEEGREMTPLSCGHPFCSGCWRQYLETTFEGNFGGRALQTSCPIQACNEYITEELIHKVAPDLFQRYEQHKLDAFVEGNRNSLRWCPGPECHRIAVKPRDNLFFGCNLTAFCKDGCQRRFCFQCTEEPHDGPCNLIEIAYHHPNQDNSNQTERKPKDKTIQRCPRCKAPIEKNGGCNHMTCKCGAHFCWLCNADITIRPYDHFCGREVPARLQRPNRLNRIQAQEQTPPINQDYVCDALKERDDSDLLGFHHILQKQKELERFAHYYNRFAAHHQGQDFAEGQCGCVRGQAEDFYKVSGIKTATDTDFFVAANERLVACRRMLKYSYCYVYHMTSQAQEEENVKRSSRIELFQNFQERLERFTEQLSKVSERAFTHNERQRVVDLVRTFKIEYISNICVCVLTFLYFPLF